MRSNQELIVIYFWLQSSSSWLATPLHIREWQKSESAFLLPHSIDGRRQRQSYQPCIPCPAVIPWPGNLTRPTPMFRGVHLRARDWLHVKITDLKNKLVSFS